MWLSLCLLIAALALIGRAVWLWRQQGWRARRQHVVMLIVLAAALQTINIVLMLRSPH
ncbi:hypothetical protein LU196_15810 [Pantoea sp. Mb-10]|uniref:hypothetical protein n=1 Tax=unclassified Pantoea TaxID=2630326 RepID=UPI001E374FB7|nr:MULTISPECIES: hypothetical protein [unclassified Pantoea]MCE0491502.1 hypothetical protein [Pantoea sp. Mb-10]MCE0502316.1 hypothetical protein [Pantoea sp. Pb-8]